MIQSGEYNGSKHLIGLNSEPKLDDWDIDAASIKLFIDSVSKSLVDRVRIGFLESPEGSGQCSCGKSFV